MVKKQLYLIPATLGPATETIPKYVRDLTDNVDCFVVENLRSARRHLRSVGYKKDFDSEVRFLELQKKGHQEKEIWQFLNDNTMVGLLSEAGNPCIADPGAKVVELAHQMGYQVRPLVGPNAMILGLIASGMNGQQFTFHGYIPIDKLERKKALMKMESTAKQTGYTQLFMETPYRNEQLVEAVIKACKPETLLSIACDITLETEFIQTRKVKNWKKDKPNLHKRPAVFALGA